MREAATSQGATSCCSLLAGELPWQAGVRTDRRKATRSTATATATAAAVAHNTRGQAQEPSAPPVSCPRARASRNDDALLSTQQLTLATTAAILTTTARFAATRSCRDASGDGSGSAP